MKGLRTANVRQHVCGAADKGKNSQSDRSGNDNRGRNSDSIVALGWYGVPHELCIFSVFDCNGGIMSDPKSRLDCHPGTDHRERCWGGDTRFFCSAVYGWKENTFVSGVDCRCEVGQRLLDRCESFRESSANGGKSE